MAVITGNITAVTIEPKEKTINFAESVKFSVSMGKILL